MHHGKKQRDVFHLKSHHIITISGRRNFLLLAAEDGSCHLGGSCHETSVQTDRWWLLSTFIFGILLNSYPLAKTHNATSLFLNVALWVEMSDISLPYWTSFILSDTQWRFCPVLRLWRIRCDLEDIGTLRPEWYSWKTYWDSEVLYQSLSVIIDHLGCGWRLVHSKEWERLRW